MYVVLMKRGKDGGYFSQDFKWQPVHFLHATKLSKDEAEWVVDWLKKHGYYPEIVSCGELEMVE